MQARLIVFDRRGALNPRLFRIIIPLMFGLLAGAIGIQAVRSKEIELQRKYKALADKLTADYKGPVDVIIAKQDIAQGTEIQVKFLTLAKVPEKFIQPYATASPNELVGLISIAPIAKGEQLLKNKLRKPNEIASEASLSGVLTEDKRAITIGSDALTGVGGFIRPGDNVDILWTVKLPASQGGESVTMVLFQDVPVLAVANQMVGHASSNQENSRDYTITLALTPQEASLLLYAREQGRVQLSLRSPADKGKKVAIAPANSHNLMEAILGKDAVTPPPPPPSNQKTVEVIKGLERTLVAVENSPENK